MYVCLYVMYYVNCSIATKLNVGVLVLHVVICHYSVRSPESCGIQHVHMELRNNQHLR